MTEQEIEFCLERFTMGKATDVMNFDYAGTLAYLQRLKSENADLRKRLETAVELKAKVGDTIYMPWVWSGKSGIAVIEVIYIQIFADELEYHTDFETDDLAYSAYYKFGKFRVNDFGEIVFTDREAAEARLAELKGGEHE